MIWIRNAVTVRINYQLTSCVQVTCRRPVTWLTPRSWRWWRTLPIIWPDNSNSSSQAQRHPQHRDNHSTETSTAQRQPQHKDNHSTETTKAQRQPQHRDNHSTETTTAQRQHITETTHHRDNQSTETKTAQRQPQHRDTPTAHPIFPTQRPELELYHTVREFHETIYVVCYVVEVVQDHSTYYTKYNLQWTTPVHVSQDQYTLHSTDYVPPGPVPVENIPVLNTAATLYSVHTIITLSVEICFIYPETSVRNG